MADAAIDSQTPLVNAARHGDRAALQRLLLRVDRDVRQYVYRRLPDGSIEGISPDDIVQDVLFEASVNVAQFRDGGVEGFRAWILRIARYRVINARLAARAGKRGGGVRAVPLDGDPSVVDIIALFRRVHQSPSQEAGTTDSLRIMRQAMEQLLPDERMALTMRFLEDKSPEEVAAHLGRTRRAVHQLTYRALDKLRVLLGSTWRHI
jgi:RNA polymerase sigma-70 factor (ECF subfamily)